MDQTMQAWYRDAVLKMAKSPYHEGKPEGDFVEVKAYNPLCGDQYTLFLRMEGDRVAELWWQGFGCAISKAATSVLAKHAEGLSVAAFEALLHNFLQVVAADATAKPEDLVAAEELQAFVAARDFPERATCATLSWEALGNHLQ